MHTTEAREVDLDPIATTRANLAVRGDSERRANLVRSLSHHTQRTAALARTGHRAIA
jgi:hypothetical protein